MNRILTCTDGSVYSSSVYDHSAWLALRCNASIHVIHMLDPHRERAGASDLSGNLEVDAREGLLRKLVSLEENQAILARERGKLLLDEAKRHLTTAGVERVTTEQQHGQLVEMVNRIEASADLIVIGKRGEAADFAKLHLGTNLERVIRASVKPVFVASRQFKPIHRFLIAYDGGPSIEKAITFLQQHPLVRDLECHIVRAGKIDADADWFLQEAAGKLRDAGYRVTASCVAGDPEKVISENIKSIDIQLLLMGAYGHSRIRQLMVGSTTTAMVRTCQVPVLMFR